MSLVQSEEMVHMAVFVFRAFYSGDYLDKNNLTTDKNQCTIKM